ncbi:MAG: 4'-phosphopantetheinyl transferase superfamily protein [Desulfobulbaceae bacterium]|nr:4'-phosphopantetheinyl transferase superfamily protein [Desulfobulbaceae bacterium]
MTTDTSQGSGQPNPSTFFQHDTSWLNGIRFFHHRATHPVSHHISLVDLERDFSEGMVKNGNRLPERFLSPDELSFYHDIRHPKRKSHWLGGRAALKHALFHLFTPAGDIRESDPATLSILPDSHGRPTLKATLSPVPAISISHSGRYAIALAAETPTCGIDIQLESERIFNVCERLLNAKEWKILHNMTTDRGDREKLTKLWAAKEAVKKGMLSDQPLVFSGITLRGIIPGDPVQMVFTCSNPRHPSALVQVLSVNDYQLAYTLGGADDA